MTAYLLHSSILLAGLVIFYWLFLRKETFFALNRWTFVFSIILSLLLPLLNVPASMSLRGGEDLATSALDNIENVFPLNQAESIATDQTDAAKTVDAPIAEPATVTANSWSWSQLIFGIYIIGVLIFLVVFLVQILVLLTRKYNLNSVKTGKYTIVELIKEEEPYSFMNTIFINPNIYSPETYEQIIEHEKLHIDQAHFVDKFLAEFTLIIFWFNPFAWMLRSVIGKNLEFLTDQTLLKNGMEKESYQLSLLKVSVSTKPFNMVNSYNNSFLKNRILMMNSKNSSIASTWKYLFILPLFFLSLISLNAVTQNEIKPASEEIGNSLVQAEGEVEKSKKKTAKKNSKKKQKPAKEKDRGKAANQNKEHAKSKLEQENQLKSLINVETGAYISRNLDLDPFSKIVLSVPGNLVLEQSNQQSVRIEGPAELIDLINTQVIYDEWKIKFPDKSYNKHAKPINISVSLPDLRAIGVSGTGNVTSKGKFDLNHDISYACSGVGNIKFEANASNVKCAVSGSGNMNIKGTGETLKIALSGSGNVITENLKVREADVVVSGSGNISVNAHDYLNVVISGSGMVDYRGNPKLKSKYSGSGRAVKKD